MQPTLTEQERFFYDNAAYGWFRGAETVEQGRARTARLLAEAETRMLKSGWRVDWEDDFKVVHVREYDSYDSEPSTCEYATLRDHDGNWLASLGCIDDATDAYRRVIAAELAAEASAAVIVNRSL